MPCGRAATGSRPYARTGHGSPVLLAVRGLVLGSHLTPARAEDALTDFDDLAIERWPSSDGLRRRAFQLRHNVSAYDAAYIALAEALDCPMLTRDQRLRTSASHHVRIEVL
jgi:predicted nucleic acid-binding protein